MQCERHPPRGERQTATAATVFLCLAVWMPVTPSFANDDPGKVPAETATAATESKNDRGWFRKLFKRKAAPVVEQDASKDEDEARIGKVVEREGVEDEPADRPKRGLAGLGKKLAGFLSIEDGREGLVEPSTEVAEQPLRKGDSPTATRIDKFVITEDGTPLYEDGPLQTQPVELKLDSGVIVSVVKWRKGWTDVRLETGEFGTISTDLLRKAKASDFPVEELVIKTVGTDEDGQYVDAVLPDMLPLLDAVELPDFSLLEEEGGSDPLGLNPLLLPPLPE